jgi:hypothetical protein
MKMLIEIYADGYETPEAMNEACVEMVEEWLDSSAVSTKILWREGESKEELLKQIDK